MSVHLRLFISFNLRKPVFSLSLSLSIYIYIYIYICVCVCVCVCITVTWSSIEKQRKGYVLPFLRKVTSESPRITEAFANGPGDLGSIPGRVIPKTQKMVPDASLLNIQHYKIQIKGKVEQARERSSALPYTLL